MRTALVTVNDPVWGRTLRGLRHDVYHLPAYARFAAVHQEMGEPAAFLAEEPGGRFLVSMILRPLPSGGRDVGRDATCPRGYPGPIVGVDADAEPGFAARAIAALRARLQEVGVVALFSRLHPLLHPGGSDGSAFAAAGTVIDHGESVSIDLEADDVAWRRGMRANHRRDIDRALRDGFVGRIDEEWSQFDAFLDAYDESMERLGAAPFWRLSAAYFEDLRAALGEHVRLCVVERGGRLAAGGLLTEVDGIVEYHLAGTASEFVKASPSKLIVDFARRWARERGNRTLHLAGSLGTGDSLHRFKIGFSNIRHPVRSWRLIVDPARYDALTAAWERSTGRQADSPSGFFPPYRRPIT